MRVRIFLYSILLVLSSLCFSQTVDTVAIACISDTQSPLWYEALFVARNRNEEATEMLIRHIAQDTTLSALFHFGDVTESSSRSSSWERIDTLLALLRKRQCALYATPGNHDYLYTSRGGEEQFRKRFSSYTKTGMIVRLQRLAVILLNSNFSNLTDEEQRIQENWYRCQLDSLETDSTVVAVIVGCHHAPYTNNTIIRPSKEVEERFVAPFLQYQKCKIFLSGHSHAIEHFRKDGKEFLVIGGGGGLQHRLLTGKEQKWTDLFPLQQPKRMFHYLRIKMRGSELILTVFMVKDDFSGIEPVYTFTVPVLKQKK